MVNIAFLLCTVIREKQKEILLSALLVTASINNITL